MATLVRVWDLPTRVFHWALVAAVIGLVTTAQLGGAAMEWHFRFGYLVLSLLLFRIIWGFAGGHWSRFSNFMFSPRQVLAYLKGQTEHTSPGHNPLGALSVFAMLLILMLQVASGLFSDDEIAATGPLAKWATGAQIAKATFYHKEIGKLFILALVVLHIAAILFYLYRRRLNLVRPMLLGDREFSVTAPESRDNTASRIGALVIWLVCLALVVGMVRFSA
jgi:cytochrome b